MKTIFCYQFPAPWNYLIAKWHKCAQRTYNCHYNDLLLTAWQLEMLFAWAHRRRGKSRLKIIWKHLKIFTHRIKTWSLARKCFCWHTNVINENKNEEKRKLTQHVCENGKYAREIFFFFSFSIFQKYLISFASREIFQFFLHHIKIFYLPTTTLVLSLCV
jgi:hypothetical protein